LMALVGCLERFLDEGASAIRELDHAVEEEPRVRLKSHVKGLREIVDWTQAVAADLRCEAAAAELGMRLVETREVLVELAGIFERRFPQVRVHVAPADSSECFARAADLAEAFYLGLACRARSRSRSVVVPSTYGIGSSVTGSQSLCMPAPRSSACGTWSRATGGGCSRQRPVPMGPGSRSRSPFLGRQRRIPCREGCRSGRGSRCLIFPGAGLLVRRSELSASWPRFPVYGPTSATIPPWRPPN
jgi:hypothetical protein